MPVFGARYGPAMDDHPDPLAGPALAACPSCFRLHPDEQRCACIIARAQVLAENMHERRRAEMAGWRRPRTWTALPERVRQDLTVAALDVVDLLEGSGWRLVLVSGRPRHERTERDPDPAPAVLGVADPAGATAAMPARFTPDPEATTPPSGEFRVPNVVRSVP